MCYRGGQENEEQGYWKLSYHGCLGFLTNT